MKFTKEFWDRVDDDKLLQHYLKHRGKGMLVYVEKKTRSRFGENITVGQPGEYGVVVGEWMSSYGTDKRIFIDAELRERGTTMKACRFWGLKDDPTERDWNKILLGWMDKTYVPILVTRKKKEFKRKHTQAKQDEWVISRDGTSALVSLLSDAKKTTWIKKDFIHPADQKTVFQSQLKCCSVRVPLWLAKKMGAY